MDIIKQHLNPIFRPRVPKPSFPAPGPFKTSQSCVLNASGVFSPSNLHVEMGRTIVQPIRSKHLEIFTIFENSFASPSGKTHFRKAHTKRKCDHRVGEFSPPTIEYIEFRPTQRATEAPRATTTLEIWTK